MRAAKVKAGDIAYTRIAGVYVRVDVVVAFPGSNDRKTGRPTSWIVARFDNGKILPRPRTHRQLKAKAPEAKGHTRGVPFARAESTPNGPVES